MTRKTAWDREREMTSKIAKHCKGQYAVIPIFGYEFMQHKKDVLNEDVKLWEKAGDKAPQVAAIISTLSLFKSPDKKINNYRVRHGLKLITLLNTLAEKHNANGKTIVKWAKKIQKAYLKGSDLRIATTVAHSLPKEELSTILDDASAGIREMSKKYIRPMAEHINNKLGYTYYTKKEIARMTNQQKEHTLQNMVDLVENFDDIATEENAHLFESPTGHHNRITSTKEFKDARKKMHISKKGFVRNPRPQKYSIKKSDADQLSLATKNLETADTILNGVISSADYKLLDTIGHSQFYSSVPFHPVDAKQIKLFKRLKKVIAMGMKQLEASGRNDKEARALKEMYKKVYPKDQKTFEGLVGYWTQLHGTDLRRIPKDFPVQLKKFERKRAKLKKGEDAITPKNYAELLFTQFAALHSEAIIQDLGDQAFFVVEHGISQDNFNMMSAHEKHKYGFGMYFQSIYDTINDPDINPSIPPFYVKKDLEDLQHSIMNGLSRLGPKKDKTLRLSAIFAERDPKTTPFLSRGFGECTAPHEPASLTPKSEGGGSKFPSQFDYLQDPGHEIIDVYEHSWVEAKVRDKKTNKTKFQRVLKRKNKPCARAYVLMTKINGKFFPFIDSIEVNKKFTHDYGGNDTAMSAILHSVLKRIGKGFPKQKEVFANLSTISNKAAMQAFFQDKNGFDGFNARVARNMEKIGNKKFYSNSQSRYGQEVNWFYRISLPKKGSRKMVFHHTPKPQKYRSPAPAYEE